MEGGGSGRAESTRGRGAVVELVEDMDDGGGRFGGKKSLGGGMEGGGMDGGGPSFDGGESGGLNTFNGGGNAGIAGGGPRLEGGGPSVEGGRPGGASKSLESFFFFALNLRLAVGSKF